MSLRRSFVISSMVATIAISACGGGDSTSTASDAPTTESSTTETPATEAPPTTLDPAVEAMMYTEAGPYPVGVTTLELAAPPLATPPPAPEPPVVAPLPANPCATLEQSARRHRK